MKSFKPIQEAFRKLDTSTATWHKTARFPKSMETANSILYRDAAVDACTLAYMSQCLGLSNKATVSILEAYAAEVAKKAAEVAVLKKLIAPVDLTNEEQEVITRLRKLDDAKRHLVFNMIEGLLK